MTKYWLTAILTVCLVIGPSPTSCTNIWTDILLCVNELANNSTTPALNQNFNSTNVTSTDKEPIKGDFSMMKLFSIICGDKDGFVQCLDTSLKKSNDSMTQIIGSFFDPAMVTQAYEGLCTNISAIELDGLDVLSCLSTDKMASCQNEMADYFFYMGVVKQFAPPSEQLSRSTTKTLLCSVTSQRRSCEVQALRKCNENLADVMAQFYIQTQPASCAELERADDQDSDNKIE